jgi:outer membrane beta-barrel protein
MQTVPRADVQVVGTSVAVVRSGPGTEHGIVTTVHEGQVLALDAKSGVWDHVELRDGTSGWVHQDYLRVYVDSRRFEFVPDPGHPSRQRTFHLVAYYGTYAADREDNGPLLGGRIGYSLTPRWAFEAAVGRTHVTRTTYVIERIFNLRLEQERFDLFFYEAGVSMDVLPGRRVSPFVGAGLGASVLDARVESTWSLGVGTRAFLTKRVGLRWELRDHHMRGGNRFTRFTGNNLEFSGGAEMLF